MKTKKSKLLQEFCWSLDNLKYIMKIMLKVAPLFLILTLLFSVFSGLGNVVQSFLISKIIDGIIGDKSFVCIGLYAVVIIVFQFFSKLQSRTLFALNRVVTEEISVDMESTILDSVEDIPLCKMDEPKFLNRMEQARNLTKRTPNSVFMLLFGSISLIAGTIGYIVILGQISLIYVLILIVCSVLIFIANNRYEENVMSFLFAMSPERRKMEYFSNLLTKRDFFEEVHAYGATSYMRNEYKKNAKKQIDASWNIFKHYAGTYGIAAFVAYLGCAVVYLLIIRKALLGEISLGDTTMFLTACLGFQTGLTELTDGLCSLPAQLNALQNYREFVDELKQEKNAVERNSINTRNINNEGVLVRVENLTFTYPNTKKHIIDNGSFEIKYGECVALVGTNGSGKTTLVRLLAGFYKQYEGKIKIAGVDRQEFYSTEQNPMISVLFQNYLKPSMSVGESIAYAPLGEVDPAKILEVLEKSAYQLEDLPQGIQTNLTKMFSADGVVPSGGQWQKLALARMLYRDAPLYILDEPSASLDPKAEDEVFRMLMNMKHEHAILFITHRLASVSMADSVIYLTPNGQILQGTHEELMQSCTSYRELYELQASKYHQKEGDKHVGDSAC